MNSVSRKWKSRNQVATEHSAQVSTHVHRKSHQILELTDRYTSPNSFVPPVFHSIEYKHFPVLIRSGSVTSIQLPGYWCGISCLRIDGVSSVNGHCRSFLLDVRRRLLPTVSCLQRICWPGFWTLQRRNLLSRNSH